MNRKKITIKLLISIIFMVVLWCVNAKECFAAKHFDYSDLAEVSGDVDGKYCLDKGLHQCSDGNNYKITGPFYIEDKKTVVALKNAYDNGDVNTIQDYFWYKNTDTSNAIVENDITDESIDCADSVEIGKSIDMRTDFKVEEAIVDDNATINGDGKNWRVTVKENCNKDSIKVTFKYKIRIIDAAYYYEYIPVNMDGKTKCKDGYKEWQRLAEIHFKERVKTGKVSINIDVYANVEVNKYIQSIGGNTVPECKDGNASAYSSRTSWTEPDKQNSPAIGEVGDEITYKIKVKNKSNGRVYAKLKDILPSELTNVKVNGTSISGNSITNQWENGNSGYVKVPKNNTKTFTITGIIKTDPNKVATNTVTIQKLCLTPNEEKKNVIENIASEEKQTSSDHFLCKKYNVSVDKYISQVTRANGSGTLSGEKLVDNGAYAIGNRNDKSDSVKSDNPVYIENGDFVTYTIELKNEANEKEPYYDPNQIKVYLNDILPTETSIVENISGECEWNQNGTELTITAYVKTGEVKKLQCKVRVNSDSQKIYDYSTKRKNTAKIINVENINGKTTKDKDIENTVPDAKLTSSDYFQIKEYNIVVDKYITSVKHAESRGGALTTFENEDRKSYIDVNNGKGDKDDMKSNSPVSVEYGDIVTYEIIVYNTTNESNYNVKREDAPYKEPQYITVNLTDTLPNQYSNLSVTGATAEVNGNTMKLDNVQVDANGVTKITVVLTVEEANRGTVETNTVKLEEGSEKNINQYKIKNNGNRYTSLDKYILNDYSVQLDEYIYEYNAEMAEYNETYGFTLDGTTGKFTGSTTNYPSNNPLAVEKYETLTFATKVTNTASGGEEEESSASPAKYNTRVRPTDVGVRLDAGLQLLEYYQVWHHNGKEERIDSSRINSSTNNSESNKTEYIYTIQDENIILSPGDYIVYYTKVKVMESNMYLGNLQSYSRIITLTNVNRNIENAREVTEQTTINIVTDQDFVHLKELVIAGTVWFDEDRDGYKKNESGKPDVRAKLYRNNELVKTVTTRADGLYTFERQNRADNSGNYYNYYVEFEYDGQMYKATEVYGGISSGQSNGTNHLGDIANWRQGYSGLPDVKSGSEDYMIDSNAYEFDDVRNNFDENYGTIGFNKAYNAISFESAGNLSYDKNGHVSTLIEGKDNLMTARSFIIQDYNTTVNRSAENTKLLFLSQYNGYSNEKPETEYLKFINLGLVKREEVDLSIDADVYSVKTTINGEQMTYDFNQNDAESWKDDYDRQINAYKLAEAYNFNLYQSDFNYRTDEYYSGEQDLVDYKANESELNAEVTYRIRITNNKISNDEPNLPNKDIPVEAALNELVVYYDSNFKNIGTTNVKYKNNDTGFLYDQILNNVEVQYGTEDELNAGGGANLKDCVRTDSRYSSNKAATANGYNVLYLSGSQMDNVYIKEGENKYIQIKFIVDKADMDGLTRALKIASDGMGLEAIAEIGAYTTKYNDSYFHKGLAGKYAGLVDRDSNPSDLSGTEDFSQYEDDTYKVGVKVGLLEGGVRTITGKVWDDARSKSIGTEETGIQYLGNGEYNSVDTSDEKAQTNPNDTGEKKDKPVAGVKVSLIEIVQTASGRYYEYPARYTYGANKGKQIETVTDENGNYILSDYRPGYYIVRFDYGYNKDDPNSVLYNGQDYKSTTYYNENYYTGDYKTDKIGSVNNFSYFDKVRNALQIANKSDAQDDEIRRLNVNSYSETMTTAQAKVFSEPNRYKEALTKNTHMHADSTIFYAKPEQGILSAITNIPAYQANFDNSRLLHFNDLDFGLEYRPEASIIVDKDISTLEVVTSDNKTLIKLYFEEDEAGNKIINKEKSIGLDNTQFLQNTEKAQQGFVYVNMDTDILEGATIKVEYKMDAENNSEVDRINKNLDNIRYETGANAYGSTYKVYLPSVMDENEFNYNANGTAAEFLAQQYYNGYNFDTSTGKENYKYLIKLKKPYIADNTPNTVGAKGQEYYGMYLGQTYYTGNIGTHDTVAQLKVDSILDYIDNDFTFNSTENSIENRLWKATTSAELKNVLDWENVNVERDEDGKHVIEEKNGQKYYHLVDKFGIRYDTENKTNLALSVDDNKQGTFKADRKNVLLSKFLNTKNATEDLTKTEEYTGTISAVASKVLSADDLEKGTGLSYENIAEVVQYTSLTGRRTTLPDDDNGGVIANANVANWNGYNKWEDDTDATEIITISPPTGLTK